MFVKSAYATCPVCIVTVGGGLFIAKKLGIDDLLVSIWISGLNTTLGFWIASRTKRFIFRNPVITSLILYGLTVGYLIYSKQIGHAGNTFWNIDKILLGMSLGMFIFFLAIFIDKFLRYKNGGKVVFFYQKVIIPVLMLVVTTVLFSFLLKIK
ncbi:MAG: hypothetical protein HYW86_01575 [Candidatus Roizmanbacteria bacterium]|nr:MAG: hypothetical protein HYW86_01575 [Candidatus Roizmanbacteria bacterium]